MKRLLPDETRLGGVHLQVADLERSTAWYHEVLGARVISREGNRATLGAIEADDSAESPADSAVNGAGKRNPVLLTLHEVANSSPMPRRGRLGLFHVAWLLPDRPALGRFITHLASMDEPFGSADHLVSEALYLQDPDGLGVEVYTDRPRDTWNIARGEIEMASLPLNMRAIVQAAGGAAYEGLPGGTCIGHVHLHVGDLETSTRFYRDVIGFDVSQSSYPGARFLSAGGYHHHLGTNVWAGSTAQPAGEFDARLLRWDVVLPRAVDVDALAGRATDHQVPVHIMEDGSVALDDPWGTRVHILLG